MASFALMIMRQMSTASVLLSNKFGILRRRSGRARSGTVWSLRRLWVRLWLGLRDRGLLQLWPFWLEGHWRVGAHNAAF